MKYSEGPFELMYLDSRIRVQERDLPNAKIFHIQFIDASKKPLIITRASKPSGEHWWTSIPEGRQKEAQEIGRLIENHIEEN